MKRSDITEKEICKSQKVQENINTRLLNEY